MRFEVTVIRPSRPSEVAAMHIAAAREFMSRLRDEDALAKIQAAVAADPTSVVARQYLGGLYNVLKRPNEAIPILEQLVKEAPTRDTRLRMSRTLAYAHVLRGDFSTAAAVLRSAGVAESNIGNDLVEMQQNATAQIPLPSSGH
jgi:predicted Zn-dependent protease